MSTISEHYRRHARGGSLTRAFEYSVTSGGTATLVSGVSGHSIVVLGVDASTNGDGAVTLRGSTTTGLFPGLTLNSNDPFSLHLRDGLFVVPSGEDLQAVKTITTGNLNYTVTYVVVKD